LMISDFGPPTDENLYQTYTWRPFPAMQQANESYSDEAAGTMVLLPRRLFPISSTSEFGGRAFNINN
jgi:hypothetical protein